MAGLPKQQAHSKQRASHADAASHELGPLADLDTQLMLQVRSGDVEAASTLIRRNQERIARYLYRLVRDQRAVEDLTQTVFMKALNHADQYEPTSKLATWLYRIATNEARNHLKQPSVRRSVSGALDCVQEVADRRTPPPDLQLSLDELRHQVSEALLALPLSQRIALTLFQYEELSYEQIASVLDTSIEAVRSGLLRARTTLRRQLRGLL